MSRLLAAGIAVLLSAVPAPAQTLDGTPDSCPIQAPDEPARVIALFRPAYPDSLRARGRSDTVHVEAEVRCDGQAERSTVRVVSTPRPALRQLAWDAVGYGVFAPARIGGKPVRATLRVPVVFDSLIRAEVPEDTVEERPQLLSIGRAEYPEILRQARIRGDVLLQFIVDTAGHPEPESLVILASPDPAMSSSAIRAALTGVFRPARVRGRAVRVLVNLPIQFRVPT